MFSLEKTDNVATGADAKVRELTVLLEETSSALKSAKTKAAAAEAKTEQAEAKLKV